MSVLSIPTVADIARAARAEAEEIWAGMNHSRPISEEGRMEKWRKVLVPCGARHAEPHLQQILERYRWTYAQMEQDSSVDFRSMGSSKHPQHLLRLFEPQDVIWCGDVHEMKPENFRTRDEWLACKEPIGPFTSGSVFTPGIYTRQKTNALCCRFLIVESDKHDYDTVGAIYRWLVEENGLVLRAIVDSGSESLHAWVNYPGKDVAADLKLVLSPLGCDRQMFVPTQPCRMPGMPRSSGRFQRRIYLAGGRTQ